MRALAKPLGKIIGRLDRLAPRAAWRLRELHELRFGEGELHLVPFLCSPQRTSFDIGANRGIYAAQMLRYSKNVVAFEPNPEMTAYLRHIFRTKIQIEEAALSDAGGVAELIVPVDPKGFALDGHASISKNVLDQFREFRRVSVGTRQLDEFSGYDVGFIKMDVEGHELEVLRGGRKLIEVHRPNLLVECEERHSTGSVRNVQAFLREYGYRGYFLQRGRLLPVDEFEPETHQRLDAVVGTYVNNFLYLQSSEIASSIERNLRSSRRR